MIGHRDNNDPPTIPLRRLGIEDLLDEDASETEADQRENDALERADRWQSQSVDRDADAKESHP